MISQKKKCEIYKKLNGLPIRNFENYIITKYGKLYYINLENGKYEDISNNILEYSKINIPIYKLVNDTKSLKIRLDKLVLYTFIGRLDGKIFHKDGDTNNNSIYNLTYRLRITKINNDILKINNKEFKRVKDHSRYYISNDGIIYSKRYFNLLRPFVDYKYYLIAQLNNTKFSIHRLVYSTWVGDIPEDFTINHKDGNKRNNYYNNLEAISNSDNIRHAYKNNLMSKKCHNEEYIHIICILIEKKCSFKDICMNLNIYDKIERKKLSDLIYDIMKGIRWKSISNEYTLKI